MALRRLATKEANLITSCNTLQGNYRSPPTQLVITYYEMSHMATCFDHQVVIFKAIKINKILLSFFPLYTSTERSTGCKIGTTGRSSTNTPSKPHVYTILLLRLAPSERVSTLSKHAVLCSTMKKQEHMWTFKSADYKLTEYSYQWQCFHSIL